jgi:hypothetical protein
MIMLELALSLAIVTQDQIPLRAEAKEKAARHLTLTQGDMLELRGRRGDYLQVYDHRRERAGFIRATQAGLYELTPAEAPRLRAVAGFLSTQPGSEAMGIGHAAAFLKAAPADAIDAGIFEDIGRMADRLAWRASYLARDHSANGEKASRLAAEHLAVVENYGVATYRVEERGRIIFCYEGDAWRRVLAWPASAEQKARAALSLSRHDCVPDTLSPGDRLENDRWRAEILENALAAGTREDAFPAHLKIRLKIRLAGVWAGIAQRLARRPRPDAGAILQAGQQAETHLAGIDRARLADGDVEAWHEAAVRAGASRWAARPQTLAQPAKGRPGLRAGAGEKPGQTCVSVVPARDEAALTQCTYGQVWSASLAVAPDGRHMALAVQPLAHWRELWMFRLEADGWKLDVIPPAVEPAEVAYIEFAGWVPGKDKFLAARETVHGGRHQTRFELVDGETLKVEKSVDKPGNLSTFYRWQDPLWKGGTLAVR